MSKISIGGSVVGGNSVIINGKRIVSTGGVIVIGDSAEDMPKIHEEYADVRSVTLNDCGDVSLEMGDSFIADGTGEIKKSGSGVRLSYFNGSLVLPNLDSIDIKINSGDVNGTVKTTSVDAHVNSGTLGLQVKSDSKSPSVKAHVNSGNVNITIL